MIRFDVGLTVAVVPGVVMVPFFEGECVEVRTAVGFWVEVEFAALEGVGAGVIASITLTLTTRTARRTPKDFIVVLYMLLICCAVVLWRCNAPLLRENYRKLML